MDPVHGPAPRRSLEEGRDSLGERDTGGGGTPEVGPAAPGWVHSGMRPSSLLVLGLSVLTLGLPPAQGQEVPPALRVMSFNIHAGHGDLSRAAGVIRALRPDVVALQEVDVRWGERSGFADQATELAEATGMDVAFAPIYTLPGATPGDLPREYGVAILSRLPILVRENHLLTRLSTQEGDGAEPRPMSGLLLVTVDVAGYPVHVLSTHLDYRPDPSVRATQALEMRALVDAAPHPVILMGDLNAAPDAPEIQPLFGALRDAWTAAPVHRATEEEGSEGAEAPPPRGYTYPASAPARRIDYVLVGPSFRVVRSWVVSTDASDHHPVLAEVELTRRSRR